MCGARRFYRCARLCAAALLLFGGAIESARAQSSAIPAPWTASDIGSPTPAGTSSYNQPSGTFTIDAGGADIWDTSDQFRFIYQQVSGDVQIVARIDSVTMADQWSKSGVMIRASLSASSAHAFTLVSAAQGLAFQRRQQNGGDSLNTAGAASTAPYWVRLTRVGTQVTAAVSANGTTWTTLGTDTIALGTTAYVGIATTSHNSTNTTSADVSQVSVTAGGSGGGGGTPPPGGLPAGQTDADIGNPSLKGSATYSTGVYTVSGSGADIWGASDQFNYVYQPANGDVDVSARVSSITNTDGWTKAGVMIRETLTAGSRHASAFLTPGQGYAFQDRALTNGTSADTSTTGAAPGWVRIKRTGNLFTAYKSSDGRTWTVIASDSISMADAIYVGIALTSHNSAATAKATVDNFSVTAGQSNQPPAVSLTAPGERRNLHRSSQHLADGIGQRSGRATLESGVLPGHDPSRNRHYVAVLLHMVVGRGRHLFAHRGCL